MSRKLRLHAMLAAALIGSLVGVASVGEANSGDGYCEKNACNLDTGDCIRTDTRANCAEVELGCSSSGCDAT